MVVWPPRCSLSPIDQWKMPCLPACRAGLGIGARPVGTVATEAQIRPVECKPVVARMVRIFFHTGLRSKMIDIVVRAEILAFEAPCTCLEAKISDNGKLVWKPGEKGTVKGLFSSEKKSSPVIRSSVAPNADAPVNVAERITSPDTGACSTR